MTTFGPAEPFTTSFTVAFYAALGIVIPIILWQLWAFLAPAIEDRSQRVVMRLVAVATVLLAAGMAFAYWVVLPNGIHFLLTSTPISTTFSSARRSTTRSRSR